MCGILGQINFDNVKINENSFKNALLTQKHRGPDRTSHYFSKNVALGHVRLSIIDVEGGHQPLEIEDYVIIFNGEIYNYKLLKKNLSKDGIKFNSNSDTEVILRGYIHYGKSFLSLLNGMFAFSIYNKKEKEVLIFRDHTGQKPLFYFKNNKKFIFSSELSPIMSLVPNLNIDEIAVDTFLHLSYIPAPMSILKEVKKVSPGTYIKYSFNTNSFEENKVSHKNNLDDLKKLITETAVSDVSVGISLSAGIDSSLILSILNKKIKIAYNVSSNSFHTKNLLQESDLAKWFSESNNVKFKKLNFKNLSIEDFNNHIDCFDEPYGDSSSLMARYVAKQAKKDKIKVVLTGDGADELFAGYRKHLAFYFLRFFVKLPKRIRFILSNFIPHSKIAYTLKNSGNTNELYWCLSNMGIDTYSNKNLLKNSVESTMKIVLKNNIISSIEDLLDVDRKLLLEGDMMVKGDRVFMKHGVEARPVFATPSLLNYVKKYAAKDHLSLFMRKKKLIKFSKMYLPKKILNKPKTGYDAPLSKIPLSKIKTTLINKLSNGHFDMYNFINQDNWLNYIKKLETINHKGKRDLYVVYSLFRWLLINKSYFKVK